MVVNYNPDGSTTGRAQFKQGVVDWAASEIPYGIQGGASFDAPPTRGYAYMPDLAGGLAFTYHLSIGGHRVTSLRLSGPVIAGIFTNQITSWNDPRIAADNPGLALPATPITPVVRSDSSGTTAQFTQWMLATQSAAWTAYCQAVGRSPCTPTSTYPVQPGTAMVGQPGDGGVAAYVAQSRADGSIGYTEYAYALASASPVAKVLNAAGYYTAPTAGNVAVSLLNARINMNPDDPLYLTADLSPVHTDPDPRTYEMSYYSYMILPADLSAGTGFTTSKGFTLGAFGKFALCEGQQRVDALDTRRCRSTWSRRATRSCSASRGRACPRRPASSSRAAAIPRFPSTAPTRWPSPTRCRRPATGKALPSATRPRAARWTPPQR
jgi:ABC-type phosphate transport system substrate-binding protein